MARYFAGNSLAAFKRTHTDIQEVTTSGRFDSVFVSSGISIPDSPYVLDTYDFNATGTVWLHFEVYANTGNNREMLTFFNSGANAYRINKTGTTTYQLQSWNTVGAAWVNVGSSFTLTGTTLHRIDLKIVLGTSMEIFSAGSSLASGSVGANPVSTVTSLRLFNPSNQNGWVYSQVLIADFDTRDSRLMVPAINGNGSYTDGTGDYTSVDETVLDDSDAVTLASVGNKRSFTKAAITVPSGYVIGAMCINARGRVSGGTVTDGKIGVKSGATYSASTGRSYGSSYEPRTSIVESDPNTSAAFTQTGFNNAEVVVEAA